MAHSNLNKGTIMSPAPRTLISDRHLGNRETANVLRSQIEGGVFLSNLPQHTVIEIETMHRCYTAVVLGKGEALISGHPEYCPQPVLVAINGSTWGGSMLKLDFVGRGMHLEFHHPEYDRPIVTSRIQEIRERSLTPSTPRIDH
jgi:hypothetical protein